MCQKWENILPSKTRVGCCCFLSVWLLARMTHKKRAFHYYFNISQLLILNCICSHFRYEFSEVAYCFLLHRGQKMKTFTCILTKYKTNLTFFFKCSVFIMYAVLIMISYLAYYVKQIYYLHSSSAQKPQSESDTLHCSSLYNHIPAPKSFQCILKQDAINE